METSALTFGASERLWFLLLLPILAGIFVWAHRRSQSLVEKIVAPRLRAQLAGSVSPSRRILRASLLLASLAFGIIAIAQPRKGFVEKETKQKGRDVIIAMDTSRSMLATDIAPDRLKRAKLFTQDLVGLLQGDRIGLIAFAGSSFLQAPLTLDYAAVTNALDELDTNVIPKGGTNIAAAITTAREAFGKAEGQTRALVILTDGEELDADGISAAKQAAQEGVRIFTVGIGSPEGSLISIRTEDGRQDFVRDRSGKPVTSKLDAARLNEMASATGGFYVQIGPDAARDVFQRGIEPMEMTEGGVFTARQPRERYQWPLGIATVCLALSVLVGDRKRKLSRAVVALSGLLAFSASAHADAPGIAEYQSGQYEKAAEVFTKGLQSQPTSRQLQFNAGTSAYKLGNFDQAVLHFTDALLTDDPKLRENAFYNLANSLVRKGESAKEKEAKKTDWKSAVEHYTEALQLNPDNKLAQENRDLVKKLLEELEKQEQQNQQQQKDDKKDDKKEDQKDQQKQDSKDNSDKKDEQQKKDQSDPSDSSDKSNPSDRSDKPTPTPTPGDKKEGDLKNSQPEPKDQKPEKKEGQQAEASEEEKQGQMSPAQARGLLNSLRNEEQKVNLMQQQTSQDVIRDW